MSKLNLTSKDIFDKKFKGNKVGYDCLQVDQFLDIVIKDYQFVESNLLKTENEYQSLKTSYEDLIKQIEMLRTENNTLREKLDAYESNGYSSQDNLNLLQKINRLEFALHKAGIDPNSID